MRIPDEENSLCLLETSIKTVWKEIRAGKVTRDEATLFWQKYAEYYISLGDGVVIPPSADVFFHGLFL